MHILVCVTGQKTCERLIVEGARLAQKHEAELSVLHVAQNGTDFLGNPKESEAIEYLYQISAAHGADMALIKAQNVMETLSNYARRQQADMVVVGSAGKGDQTFARKLAEKLPDVQIHVVSGSEESA